MSEMNLNTGGAAGAQQTATVQYSVYNRPNPNFVGQTVQQVRQQLKSVWQIPDDAQAFKGKTQLDPNYVIQAGDDIEFHRKQGEKG